MESAFLFWFSFCLRENVTRIERSIKILGYQDISKILKIISERILTVEQIWRSPSQYCWLVRAFTSALRAADQGGEHEAIASISVLSPVCMNYY